MKHPFTQLRRTLMAGTALAMFGGAAFAQNIVIAVDPGSAESNL